MEADITRLTFLADPIPYQAQTDEVCAHVPAGISSQEELFGFLEENLGFPTYGSVNWSALNDMLGYWDTWRTPPQRVVLIHTDVPFLQSGTLWWIDLQGYLMALINSITTLQKRNAVLTDPLEHRELVAIFPSQMYEEIQAVLTRTPDWQLTIGFFDYRILHIVQIDPDWDLVLQYLSLLDGLTAEMCTLSRKDLGTINVQYLKNKNVYCVKYQSPDRKVSLFASPEEEPPFPPVVSFSLASQILETYFHRAHRLDSLSWSALSDEATKKLEDILERLYYQSDEEMLLDLFMGDATYSTIAEGIQEAVRNDEDPFSLTYWRDILGQSETTLTRRLAALCVIGRSGLPEATALLRPFLHSPVKQERWVCVRFCGLWHNEEALPLLFSMLIDEFPIKGRKRETEHDGLWYDFWRLYAPRLLRQWQTPEVAEQLRQALIIWIRASPQFDPDITIWQRYEEELCYELGYRGVLSTLRGFPFKEVDEEDEEEIDLRFILEKSLKQGYKIKEKHLTAQQEYVYRRHPWDKHDFMQ